MKELSFNEQRLAKKARVSQSTVNRLLNTPIKSRIDTLQKVSAALGLPPEYFTIPDEKRALLCRTIHEMNEQDLQATIFHVEKEKLWKNQHKAQ